MRLKHYIAIASLLYVFLTKTHAQDTGLTIKQVKTPQYFHPTGSYLNKPNLFIQNKTLNQSSSPTAPSPKAQFSAKPLAFSVDNLPFFCKLEYKMGVEKKYPLKIRLGDVQYVDQLEGKRPNDGH